MHTTTGRLEQGVAVVAATGGTPFLSSEAVVKKWACAKHDESPLDHDARHCLSKKAEVCFSTVGGGSLCRYIPRI